jgi:hypothetical protein
MTATAVPIMMTSIDKSSNDARNQEGNDQQEQDSAVKPGGQAPAFFRVQQRRSAHGTLGEHFMRGDDAANQGPGCRPENSCQISG